MRLYSYWRSSSAWRVRIALHLKEIDYELVPVSLLRERAEHRSSAHLERNPMGQVPTLEWTEDGRVRRLSQSIAIVAYLEAVRPTPALFPPEPYARARALQLAEIVNSGIQPLQNSATLERLEGLGVDAAAWARDSIARGLAAVDAEARREPYEFLVGDAPSIADVFLVPQLYNARRFGVELSPFERLLEIEARCEALPAFVAAHPEKQIDRPET